tara:strand:- start:2707 stop:4728 length:2022 start_codon:yes stop_codon:yes gene_type:complete
MTANEPRNIPAELRSYDQWICHDAAKRPINPHTGHLADVTAPATWGTYDEASAAVQSGRGVGIGFVLTDRDPFFGVDLDVPEGGEPSEGQRRIYDAFNSYSERSPSKRGLHIIGKGRVPGDGVRNTALGVEAYSSGRYFTMTGDVVRDVPIAERQALLEQLCAELRPQNSACADPGDVPERETDDAIVDRAKAAANGAKFVKLWEGDWQKDYPSQSEADQALANFLAFYTQNRAQIARMFRASALGERPKARRDDYVGKMVAKALDRVLPPIDFTAFKQRVNDTFTGWKVQLADAGWFAASDFAGKPVMPRPWHAPGFIPTGQVTALYGDGGTGKSTVAMQLAASTALGTRWLGLEVREGRVIYLSAEDDADELHRRLAGMGDVKAMHRLTLRSLAGEYALLAAPQARTGALARTPLFDALDNRMTLERPALLVLDTLADFFGGNENDRAQARQFIGMLRGLAIRHDCAVLLLSHPSVAGISSGVGSSGSTAWNNSVRSRLYLSRVTGEDGYEPNPDARRLAVKKSNYGRIGAEILLHWDKGVFVAEEMPTRAEHYAKAESVFVKLLAEYASQGRRVNASGGQNYAPNVFAAHPESDGITKRAFKDAMEKLLATGRVVAVETGPASRRRSHLEVGNPVPTLFQPENRPFQPPSNPASDPPSNPVPTGAVPTPL